MKRSNATPKQGDTILVRQKKAYRHGRSSFFWSGLTEDRSSVWCEENELVTFHEFNVLAQTLWCQHPTLGMLQVTLGPTEQFEVVPVENRAAYQNKTELPIGSLVQISSQDEEKFLTTIGTKVVWVFPHDVLVYVGRSSRPFEFLFLHPVHGILSLPIATSKRELRPVKADKNLVSARAEADNDWWEWD